MLKAQWISNCTCKNKWKWWTIIHQQRIQKRKVCDIIIRERRDKDRKTKQEEKTGKELYFSVAKHNPNDNKRVVKL